MKDQPPVHTNFLSSPTFMNTFLPSLAATSQNPNSAVLHIKHGGRLFREGECHKERKKKQKTESCKQWTVLRVYSAIHCFLIRQLNLIHHKRYTQTDPGRVADLSHITATSRGHCPIQGWTSTSIHVTLHHNKQNILLIALIVFLEAYICDF